MKIIQKIYCILEALFLIALLVGGYFLGYASSTFYYLFTSLLLLVSPFIALIFILIIEIRKIEFNRSQYVEPYLIFLIIGGSLLLWLYSKLDISLNILWWYVFTLLVFIIITVAFVIVAKKHKNEPKNGPKFIANR